MRKFLLVLIALCLAALPCLAESASPAETAEPVETVEFDFGDFTAQLPVGTMLSFDEEKVSGASFALMYQHDDLEDDIPNSLGIIWNENFSDLSETDPFEAADDILKTVVHDLSHQNIIATNVMLEGAGLGELDGKPALIVIYSMDLDCSGAGFEYPGRSTYIQTVVADEGLGTYTFTITADSRDECQPLIDIIDSIVWKK